MRTMLFANEIEPASGTDIINTVRRGIKWSTIDQGEIIQLMQTEDVGKYAKGCLIPEEEDSQKAEVVKVVAKRFCDIDDSELVYNFEPKCRNWVNLAERMSELYKGFDEYEIVTVVDVRLIE